MSKFRATKKTLKLNTLRHFKVDPVLKTNFSNLAESMWQQGCNGRKVISEVYSFFVLSLGGKVNTGHGIHFYKNNL